MKQEIATVDILAGIFGQATQKTLEKSTKKPIKYSNTLQGIPKVCLKPEIGCFVQFTGDYNGLVVMNFSADAAMELYKSYMISMGLPEDELARDCTSAEVADTIGEMINQIMGRAMQMVENKYDLSSNFGQPKALSLNSAITLTPDSKYNENRRIVFRVETFRFHLELAMEHTEFIILK